MRLSVIIVCCCVTSAVHAQTPRSIEVSAMSEIKAVPDEVVLRLAVATRGLEFLTVKRDNDQVSEKVIQLAQDHSVPKEDIKITTVDARPDYGNSNWRQAKLIAYDFKRRLEIRFTDFDKVEPFLAEAFKAGLRNVEDLHFRVSNQRQHQFKARELAITYAREKATHLTKLTGMKLGKPIRIEEGIEHNWNAGGFGGGGLGAVSPRPAPPNPEKQTPFRLAALQQSEKSDETTVSLEPGQIIIKAHVTVEFEILTE